MQEESASGKGLSLLCEAVGIISTDVTTLVGDKNSLDINDSGVGADTRTTTEQIIVNCVPTGDTIKFPDNGGSALGTDAEGPMVKVAGNSDSVRIEITFITGTRGRFIVNKRINDRVSCLYVYVSSELTGGRYRYVYFKSRYGHRESFRSFVVGHLKQCVSTWKSRGDAQRWCECNLDRLKKRVETGWLQQLKRISKKRPRSTRDDPLVRLPKSNTTISIPLYRFISERGVPVVRISFVGKFDKRPYLSVSFPAVIFADNKRRSKSMKCRFGHDKQWSCFVEKYVKTAASQWDTLEDARRWYEESSFEYWVNRLWEKKLENNR